MAKKCIALIIAISFSASLGFGQANSGSTSAGGQAAMGAGASAVAAAMLFMEADEKWTEGTVLKEKGVEHEKAAITAANAQNFPLATSEAKLGIVKKSAGAKKDMLGFVFLGMAGLSGLQGLYQLSTVAGAAKSEDDSGYSPSLDPERFRPTRPDGSVIEPEKVREELKKPLAEIAKRGIKLDEKGNMTLPNGNTANLEDLTNGNAGAFASATGLGPAEMKEIAGKMNDVNSKIASLYGSNEKNMRLSYSSGGGSSGGQGSGDGTAGGSKFDFNSLFGKMKSKDRSAASFTGPAKLFRGQPIGVAQDNIFKMVSRRYQEKSKVNYFMVGN
ncbi:MAG: hypothetical protein SGJ18_06315 [Pseudomonadota bacterium]|mgnify:CR=1 FL=1|nr:hypothetical protein [Pseudomonadota bacterium]